jgi:phosphatidylglycerophosphatase A
MSLMDRVAVFVCSFGYVGFFPIAPGTAGSAAGVVLYLLLRHFGAQSVELPVSAALFVAGAWLGGAVEKALGSIDPGPVVIDEVMGMLLTLTLIPVNATGIALGFVLFRALDVFKPFPARRFERLPGGLGMMADDAMSAVYANLLLRAAYHFAPNVVS